MPLPLPVKLTVACNTLCTGCRCILRSVIRRLSRILLLAAVALTAISHASLLSSVNASGSLNNGTPLECGNTGTSTASCTVSVSTGFTDPAASGSYQSDSMYGSVVVTSDSSVYQGSLIGHANASFSDSLLFTGGSGSGTLVFLVHYFGNARSDVSDFLAGNVSFSFNDNNFSYTTNVVNSTYESDLAFTFGTPFAISASVSARSSALGHEHAVTDASVSIVSIAVLDASGNPVTDFQFSSGSGPAYPVVTPEPATFGLFASILLVLCVARGFIDPRRLRDSQSEFRAGRHESECWRSWVLRGMAGRLARSGVPSLK